jgi:hypothetical protein
MAAAILLLAGLAGAAGANARWLPAGRMVPLLPADPRESATTLTLRSGEPPLEGAIGDAAGILRLDFGETALQLDLGAAIFLGFLPGDGFTFGVQTLDGLVRLPISAESGPFTATLEWSHLSAHYADGVRYDDAKPDNTDGWSREQVRLLVAWRTAWVTPYLGLRELVHAIPAAPRPGVQAGLRAAGPAAATWFGALDVSLNADSGWTPGLSWQSGLLARAEGGRALRLGLAAYRGPAVAGKRRGQQDAWIGGAIGFDWLGGWE